MDKDKIVALKALGFTDADIDGMVAEADAKMKSARAQGVAYKAKHQVSADALNPISNSYFAANGDKAWFGWPTDPEMEKLRDAYARETDPAKAKALAAAAQVRAMETGQFGWLGQWYGPGARRANVTGWLKAPVPVMWNIEKK